MSVLGKWGKKLHDRDKKQQAKKRKRSIFDPNDHAAFVSFDPFKVQVTGCNPDRVMHYIANMIKEMGTSIPIKLLLYQDSKYVDYDLDDLTKVYKMVFKKYYQIELTDLEVI